MAWSGMLAETLINEDLYVSVSDLLVGIIDFSFKMAAAPIDHGLSQPLYHEA